MRSLPCPPSFLPSFLPSLLTSFLPSLPPSFLPSYPSWLLLPALLSSLLEPPNQKKTKKIPKKNPHPQFGMEKQHATHMMERMIHGLHAQKAESSGHLVSNDTCEHVAHVRDESKQEKPQTRHSLAAGAPSTRRQTTPPLREDEEGSAGLMLRSTSFFAMGK